MMPDSNALKVINITADTDAIVTGGGYYFGCRVTTDGTNAARAEVKDSLTNGSGTAIDDVKGPASLATSIGGMNPFGVRFATGLSVNITTVGSVTIWYIPTGA